MHPPGICDHAPCVLQRRHGRGTEVNVPRGHQVEQAGLEVHVLGGEERGAVGVGGRAGLHGRVFQALGERAAPLAQLQVLLGAEGVHYGPRGAHRQAQGAAALPHHDRGADVGGVDLGVPPGGIGAHLQAVVPTPLAAGDGAVDERRGNVVQLRVVDLLLDALAPVFEDDSYLRSRGTEELYKILICIIPSVSNHVFFYVL